MNDKLAEVLPLLKKSGANQADPSNFRPISNLSTISKVLERLALGQLRRHLGLLSSPNFYSHQSGFRTGHSTETALLDMLNVCFVHTVIYVCWLPMYHARENMHSLDGSHNLRYAYASRGKNRTPAINYNMTYLYQFTTYTNCFRYRERRYSVFN